MADLDNEKNNELKLQQFVLKGLRPTIYKDKQDQVYNNIALQYRMDGETSFFN